MSEHERVKTINNLDVILGDKTLMSKIRKSLNVDQLNNFFKGNKNDPHRLEKSGFNHSFFIQK